MKTFKEFQEKKLAEIQQMSQAPAGFSQIDPNRGRYQDPINSQEDDDQEYGMLMVQIKQLEPIAQRLVNCLDVIEDSTMSQVFPLMQQLNKILDAAPEMQHHQI